MRTALQLTDCHLLAEPGARLLNTDTAETLKAMLRQALAESPPDLILATGDLAHDSGVAGYERFAQLLREQYQGPVLALPGNHDHSLALDRTLAEHRFAIPRDGLVEYPLGPWLVLGIDSHQHGRPEGDLDLGLVERLKARVRAADRSVLLALHHPLVPIGTPWLDKDCPEAGSALLEWLGQQRSAPLVICGHIHQEAQTMRGRCTMLGTPSTAFQFAPRSERFSLDARAPGCRWITLGLGLEWQTRVERLKR